MTIDTGETERLVGVLNTALDGTDYLVGNKYSIADIASYGWVNMLLFSGVDINDFPNVKAWADRIGARPAVQKGCAIPSKSSFGNDAYAQRLKDDKEYAEKEEKLKEQIKAAKEQYGYKYASP
jgi:glutathione S-transferase